MDTVKLVLFLVALVLGMATFFLFLEASSQGSQLRDAVVLSATVKDMLRAQSVSCAAAPEQFARMAACVAPLLQQKDFVQDSFMQPNANTGAGGYLVIKNVNKRTYDGANFTFFFDRQLSQQGCNVPGQVGVGVTCRFDLAQACEKGDILEVFYPIGGNDTRIFLKTC